MKTRAMMTGELGTTIPLKVIDPNARRRPPVPWWWGSDEDVSANNARAAIQLRR